jgi:bifunctional DNA-binding transcriptional regulator/antitoxin component of YhaV-PrlF toxin-antitoxin module
VVIPREIRRRVGLGPGEVEITVDGAGVRIEAIAGDELVEVDGRLAIPASGATIDDELVRELIAADRE